MHFSVALAGFIKSQVLHFHPPPSEGGSSPAAPQLNPPVPLLVVVVVEGVEPNPVKVRLKVGPTGLGAVNENPDVDVDGVELDVPNESGPEGGVGIEKIFPELEAEEDTPGLGVSQTVHFSPADAGFIKSQVPHFHPFVSVGGFNPAPLQLNPSEPELVEVVVEVLPGSNTKGVEGGFGIENDGAADSFSAPGFGVSHTVHFSVAITGFIKSQAPHFQPSVGRGFNPAAPQLNPPEPELVVEPMPNEGRVGGGFGIGNEGVATGLATPGLGVSHTVHFSVADAEFIKSQTSHFHPSSCFWGGFKPAAPQLNPPFVMGVVVEEPGKAVNVGVEVRGASILVLEAALLVLDGPAEVEERSQASSMGISSSANPLTSFSALNSPELFPSLKVLLDSVKVSVGSSEVVIERTSALASLGDVAAVGDTEDAEEAVSSLSALMLNRSFEGSLGADDLTPKKDLPLVVGEIVGPGDEAPLRPAVCS